MEFKIINDNPKKKTIVVYYGEEVFITLPKDQFTFPCKSYEVIIKALDQVFSESEKKIMAEDNIFFGQILALMAWELSVEETEKIFAENQEFQHFSVKFK